MHIRKSVMLCSDLTKMLFLCNKRWLNAFKGTNMGQKICGQLKQEKVEIFDLTALRLIERQAECEHLDLMNVAADAIVDWVVSRYVNTSCIWVAAGVGNNGGDALFAAHRLHQLGFDVTGIVVTAPVSPATRMAFELCQTLGMNLVERLSDLSELQKTPDLIIDGLLGIGLNREPSPSLAALIEQLNAINAPILALDVPSGLNAETGCASGALIQASDTLTFLGHKSGLWMADGADAAGRVHLVDLGWRSKSHLVDRVKTADFFGELNLNHHIARSLLTRPRNSHKGRFGSLAIVGGNLGMLGAALLAGRAALAAGVGKVWLNVLDERLAVDSTAPELMIRQVLSDVSVATAVVIGPGLGQDDAALEAFRSMLNLTLNANRAIVIDADALNIMAKNDEFKSKLKQCQAQVVLTPHPTEAARLLNCSTVEIQANRVLAAQQLSKAYSSVVVLKGAGTVVACPNGSFRVNTTGGSALAVAGQGDVLSGVIGAFLAVGVSPFDAAGLAVYVHGLAGDRYEQDAGGSIGLSANATVPLISRVLNEWLASS